MFDLSFYDCFRIFNLALLQVYSAMRMILPLFPHLSVGCVRWFKFVSSMPWNIIFV